MTGFSGGSVYEKIGVVPVINTTSNKTVLGGSLLSPTVLEAMEEANSTSVVMEELLAKSGEYIAKLLGVEAAYVTSGCAAALVLSTAGCIAGKDPEKIGRLPDTSGLKSDVLIQTKPPSPYARCFTIPGASLLEIGEESGCTLQQLEAAIGSNTAAVAYLARPDLDSSVVSLEDALTAAHAHNVPVVADAAAQVYPVDHFRSTAQSADLVCFGGKYFGAPHSTGFVCGKKGLVEAAAANGFIAYETSGRQAIGRAMKTDRQEIAGLVAALDAWLSMDHAARLSRYEHRLSKIGQMLETVAAVRSTKVVPGDGLMGGQLRVSLDRGALSKSAEELTDELQHDGNPRLRVGVGQDYTFGVQVHNVAEAHDQVIADRLRRVLAG